MIEFVACVRVDGDRCPKGEEDKASLPPIFKEMSWPVLPREEEMFQLLVDGFAIPVSEIFHWRQGDGTPNITLYFNVSPFDYNQHLDAGWENREEGMARGRNYIA